MSLALTARSRFLNSAIILAGVGAVLSLSVACGSNAGATTPTPTPTPQDNTAPAPAPKTSGPSMHGFSPQQIQQGIKNAQQARQAAGGNQTQSLSADSSQEIVGTWNVVTGDLMKAQLKPSADVQGATLVFTTDGRFAVRIPNQKPATGTYQSLGNHEYGLSDSSEQVTVGVYVVGDYLFMAYDGGVVMMQRSHGGK